MSDNKPPIPDDHPIRKVWENNQKSQTDLAKEGDKDAIKAVLQQFRYQVYLSTGKWKPEENEPKRLYRIDSATIAYLAECFDKIADGWTPNEAFNWPGKQSHPELTADEKHERAVIGWEVSRLYKKHGGDLSLTAAAKAVAKKRNNISWHQAKACYERYMKL